MIFDWKYQTINYHEKTLVNFYEHLMDDEVAKIFDLRFFILLLLHIFQLWKY